MVSQREKSVEAVHCAKCDVSLRKQAWQPLSRGVSRHGARSSETDNFGRKSARGNLATFPFSPGLSRFEVTDVKVER